VAESGISRLQSWSLGVAYACPLCLAVLPSGRLRAIERHFSRLLWSIQLTKSPDVACEWPESGESRSGRLSEPVRGLAQKGSMRCSIPRHLSCGADSEASNVESCVWRRRPDLACGAAGVARPIHRMQQRHLTCMAMAADLDWCGAGGAAHHARLMGGMLVLSYIGRYIYVRRDVEQVKSRPSSLTYW
jgi:hypothetical protein